MVRWAPVVTFPDPLPSDRPVVRHKVENTGIIYAYWFDADSETRVVKVGRTVNWKMRERSIFNNILSEYDTLPRIFCLRNTDDLTASEDALVDRMEGDTRFSLYKGHEWFRTTLESGEMERAVAKHMDVCVCIPSTR